MSTTSTDPTVLAQAWGAQWGQATPLQASAVGTDFSVNPAAVPIVGLSLLLTIPVTSGRVYVEVQNQSAGPIQVVRDNGAGANQTSIILASGGLSGSQGGSWASSTFKGRVRVYGAVGAQISAYQE